MNPIKINQTIVGQNIAIIRKRRNIKASDIAQRLQMSESNYTKYERGEINITLEFLNQIAENFNVKVIDLLISNPDNIFENIHNSYDQHKLTFQTTNAEVLSMLKNQLNIKDEQIKRLLNIIGSSAT